MENSCLLNSPARLTEAGMQDAVEILTQWIVMQSIGFLDAQVIAHIPRPKRISYLFVVAPIKRTCGEEMGSRYRP
jgi:hypothetical protein